MKKPLYGSYWSHQCLVQASVNDPPSVEYLNNSRKKKKKTVVEQENMYTTVNNNNITKYK